MDNNIIVEKSLAFAIRIVNVYKYLRSVKHETVMSKQLLRSGTSIGANIAEAIYGSSRKDFIAKLYIAEKEAAETLYWLELLNSCEYIPNNLFLSLSTDCRELLSMLAATIKTCTD